MGFIKISPVLGTSERLSKEKLSHHCSFPGHKTIRVFLLAEPTSDIKDPFIGFETLRAEGPSGYRVQGTETQRPEGTCRGHPSELS